MALKPALSIHEQIELLRQRGMIVDDEKQAVIFLQSNHYYRLNIYFHKFMDSQDHYMEGTKFSQVMSTYQNDRWMRNRMLYVLEPIEINFRTQVSHYLAMTYGADAFYQEKIFKDTAKYAEVFDNFSTEIARNKKDPVVVHHQKKYDVRFPIWVVIEFLSFNTLSKLYKNLLEPDKKAIAQKWNNTNDYLLGQWMHVMSIQRNICAHYGYLYRRVYPIRPIIAKSFKWDPGQDNELFAIFLVMKYLSERRIWQGFVDEILVYEKQNPSFDLKEYGFPSNWRSYLG
jgi:abortive infection bacteriophage resistance protein